MGASESPRLSEGGLRRGPLRRLNGRRPKNVKSSVEGWDKEAENPNPISVFDARKIYTVGSPVSKVPVKVVVFVAVRTPPSGWLIKVQWTASVPSKP